MDAPSTDPFVDLDATDPAHRATRRTTMEGYWEQYRAGAH